MDREKIVNIVIFLLIFIFILSYFKPSLIFSDTTLNGGDSGSHNYLLQIMQENLAKGKITSWSDGWYAGFPSFRFYFPFLYILGALLSLMFSFNVSFKIITILGSFLLPICAYYSFRLMRFKFPYPILASVFTLPFLFLENNSMYGGNIPSTLAGEFTYSFSLALGLLFIGLFYNGIRTKKHFIYSVLLLCAIVLSHVIPVIVLTFSCLLFLTLFRKEEFRYGFLVFVFAFLLIGFWTIPFLFYAGLTTSLNFIPDTSLSLLTPENILFLLPIAILGLIAGIRNNDKRIILFGIFSFVSVLLFLFMSKGHVWNVRFLPFYYLGVSMLAVYFIGNLYERFNFKLKYLIPILLSILVLGLVNVNVGFVDDWIKWNYSGFEDKKDWDVFDEMNLYLDDLEKGRVFHEYSKSHNDHFGTPRAFELIPFFTNKGTMEGLLIESGINSIYHFVLQSEVSKDKTCPIAGLRCGGIDIEKGFEHLELFNIKYFVVTSDEIKSLIGNDSRFTLLKEIDFIKIYELNRENKYVDYLEFEPVVMGKENFRQKSLEWFKSNETTEIIYSNDDVLYFERVDSVRKIKEKEIDYNNCFIDEEYNVDNIKLKTNCIGKPLLVKVSYFPNWKVNGGKLFAASPALMIVIPEKEDVEIYYGNTYINVISIILSILALIVLIFYRRLRIIR